MKKFSVWVHPKGYADNDSHYVTVEAETPEAAGESVLRDKKLYFAGCIGHVREIVPSPPSVSDEEAAYWAGDNS